MKSTYLCESQHADLYLLKSLSTVSERSTRCRWNNAVGRVLGPK